MKYSQLVDKVDKRPAEGIGAALPRRYMTECRAFPPSKQSELVSGANPEGVCH